jgi:heme/copper-type cytochrome/quinol oxidase subunit 4
LPDERRDDRVLAPTRWTAALIVPILTSAFVLLFLFPGNTKKLWAWTVAPSVVPMIMGGGYLSGAYFFSRVATIREWHRIGVGVLATTVFATLLGLATFLHWSRFNHDHVSFWAWLSLYLVTPVLLPVLWVNNHRHDPGPRDSGEALIPRPLRLAGAAVAAVQLAVALVMFVHPQTAIDHWPWMLTPLTARTLSAFIAFPAVMWLQLLVDERWSSFEIPVETTTLGLALVGLAILRAHAELTGSDAAKWVLALLLVATLGALVTLRLVLGRHHPSPGYGMADSGDGPAPTGAGTRA